MLGFSSSLLLFNCRHAGFEICINSARQECHALRSAVPKETRDAESVRKLQTNRQWKYLMRSALFHYIKPNTCLALISIDFHLWTRIVFCYWADLFVSFGIFLFYVHSVGMRTIGRNSDAGDIEEQLATVLKPHFSWVKSKLISVSKLDHIISLWNIKLAKIKKKH